MLDMLRDIGFTEGEIKVYRALLRLGKSTIGPISREAKVTPAKTYPVLHKLMDKGLIGRIKENRTQVFTPCQPERILTYLDERKFEIEKKKAEIERSLPHLRALRQSRVLDVRILKGLAGLKTFYEEHNRMLCKSRKAFKVFSFEDAWKKEEVKRFIMKQDIARKRLGIEVRVIANSKIRRYIDKDEYALVNIKFSSHDLPVGTVVSSTQVALITWTDEPVVVVIDSDEIGKAYEKFFDDIWKNN